MLMVRVPDEEAKKVKDVRKALKDSITDGALTRVKLQVVEVSEAAESALM